MKANDVKIGKKVIWRTWAGNTGVEATIISEPQKICGLWSCWIDKNKESVPLNQISEI